MKPHRKRCMVEKGSGPTGLIMQMAIRSFSGINGLGLCQEMYIMPILASINYTVLGLDTLTFIFSAINH